MNLPSTWWGVLWPACLPAGWAQQAGKCIPAPSGLVAWWPGDGDPSDAAGSNNGVLMGGATASTPGLVGEAFSFEGLGSHVQLPILVAGQPEGTVEDWFKLRSWDWVSANDGRYLWSSTEFLPDSGSSWDGADLGTHRRFSQTGGELMFGLESDSGWHWELSGVVPQTNVCYHVSGTWGAGGINISIRRPGRLHLRVVSWPSLSTSIRQLPDRRRLDQPGHTHHGDGH